MRQEQPAWEKAGISLCYLPSYSPKLSRIEPIWQDVKYRELPQRSHEILGELKGTVAAGLTKKAADLLAQYQKPAQLLQRAA